MPLFWLLVEPSGRLFFAPAFVVVLVWLESWSGERGGAFRSSRLDLETRVEVYIIIAAFIGVAFLLAACD